MMFAEVMIRIGVQLLRCRKSKGCGGMGGGGAGAAAPP